MDDHRPLDPEVFIRTYYSSLPKPEFKSSRKQTQARIYSSAAKELGVLVEDDGRDLTFYRDGNRIGELRGMLSSLVARSAVSLCRDKVRSLNLLREQGVPCPQERSFACDARDNAANYASSLNFNVVIKPSHGRAGRGITVGADSIETFHDGFTRAAEVAEDFSARSPRVIVQERVSGIDVRATVVDGNVVCATTRVPAHVVGNGDFSIGDLIAEKNAERAQNPYLRRHPVRIDAQGSAAASNITEEIVPEPGEVVFLADAGNVHLGAEPIDVTPFLDQSQLDIAIAAAGAIEGGRVIAVDFMVEGFSSDARSRVIELNAGANFGMHVYPLYGVSRNPALAVLESMLNDHAGAVG